jgi:hypothetical protein
MSEVLFKILKELTFFTLLNIKDDFLNLI